MAKVLVTETYLEDIGDAIREQNGEETQYKPAEMANAILDLSVYPEPTGTKSITANGTGIDVKDYASADVNVPNSYSQSDEGKVVSEGALVAQTSKSISANGTVDTTLNDEVVVAVPNSYTASDEGKVVSNGALVAQGSQTITENGTYDTTLVDETIINVSGGGGGTIEPIIPVMTSNTTPSGVASCSSTLGTNFAAYKAFDGNDVQRTMQGGWLAGASDTAPWLAYAFSSESRVDSIKLRVGNNGSTATKVVYIEGLNDSNEWENCLESGEYVSLTFTAGTYGESSTEYTFSLNGNTYSAIRIRGIDKFYYGTNQTACTFGQIQVYKRDLITKTVTENGVYKASDDGASGYSQVTVNVSGGDDDEPVPSVPSEYQKVEYIHMGVNNANQYINILSVDADSTLKVKFQPLAYGEYPVLAAKSGESTNTQDDFELYIGGSMPLARLWARNGSNFEYFSAKCKGVYPEPVVLDTPSGTNTEVIHVCEMGVKHAYPSETYPNETIRIGYYRSNINFRGYCYYVKITSQADDSLEHFLVPCYRKADDVIGFYDTVDDVFYTNEGSGSFDKGADVN